MTAHAPDLLEVPASGRVLGRPVLRSEDQALLTGTARYLDDVPCEGALYGVFVRSPIAHALVQSIDVDEARTMAGVVGVFVAEDMGGLRMPPVEDSPEVFARPLLAMGRVRFVGEPVAVVVAQTRAQAMDAADAVAVDYEPLAPVIDPEAALEPGAPILFPAHGSNLAIRVDDVAEDPDALEGAEIVVRARFVNQRVAPVPMEANGALAIAGADPSQPSVTLWASVQAPHDTRRVVAQVLRLDPAQVRVRTAVVGGGFGGKIPTYPEHVVIAWLARHMGSAVRWSETRSENMLAMTHGRGQVQYVELGATLDGRILGLRVFVIQDIGAYASEAATLPPLTGLMASGPYRIPRIDFHAVSVVTTTTPVGAYRGAGRPEATWLLERALDMLAAELGTDPAEIRRRNFIPREAFPYRTPTGATYDSGDPGGALDIALRAAGYTDLRQEQAARIGRGATWQLGIGIGSYVEITGWGSEFASVEADDQGTFTVLTGTSPQGQGHETAWAQIAADTLGVSFDAVTVRHSDTLLVPRGEGTMGSRSLQVGGSAVLRASVALLDKARRLAAHLLDDERERRAPPRRPDRRRRSPGAVAFLGRARGRRRGPVISPARHGDGVAGAGRLRDGGFDLSVRRPRRGRRGRHRDGEGDAGPSRRGGRLRAPHQPDARRGPDPRGDRAGRRPGAVRILRLRRAGQSVDVQPRHVRDAERGGAPLVRHRLAGDPHRPEPIGGQGRRRGGNYRSRARGPERGDRCARPSRCPPHRHADEPGPGLAGHPGRATGWARRSHERRKAWSGRT